MWCRPSVPGRLIITTPVPPVLSSLLQRTRVGILMLLLVVLPLQSVAQLVAGVQGHRHLHTGSWAQQGSALASLTRPLRALLDHLHAAQDPRLVAGFAVSTGPADGLHQHGGVFHKHTHDTADVLDVGDPAEDAAQGGATAFLAWLPTGLAVPAGEGVAPPVTAVPDWRDRVVAPLLTPPRG
jgi:hypothetical protein